jgi:hypothetical protein
MSDLWLQNSETASGEVGSAWSPRVHLSAHIEKGYLKAERGDVIDGAQARREIQAMKGDWRLSKRGQTPNASKWCRSVSGNRAVAFMGQQ